MQSLNLHAEGRELVERRLRQSGYCDGIEFAVMQRNIYQAQNFIDLGESEAALQRQHAATCTRVCSALPMLRNEPVPDCHERCRKTVDTDFYAVPPPENVEVLKALQDQIPTAYILSWAYQRTGAGAAAQ